MHLAPFGPYLTVALLPPPSSNGLWTPPTAGIAREAMVLHTGPLVPSDLSPDTAVLVSTRYLTQVGDAYLLHHSGVLGILAYSAS